MNKQQVAAARQRALELCIANGGRLTPDAMVEDARSKRSALHPFFEWDDKKAAHAHRIEQARDLISRWRVVHHDAGKVAELPEFVRDPSAAWREQGYVRTITLRDDEARATAALREEVKQVAARMRRAMDLAIGLGMEGRIAEIYAEFRAYQDWLDRTA